MLLIKIDIIKKTKEFFFNILFLRTSEIKMLSVINRHEIKSYKRKRYLG